MNYQSIDSGPTKGFRCRKCVWHTRSDSARLRDVENLIQHGMNYHRLPRGDALNEFVHEAQWEERNEAKPFLTIDDNAPEHGRYSQMKLPEHPGSTVIGQALTTGSSLIVASSSYRGEELVGLYGQYERHIEEERSTSALLEFNSATAPSKSFRPGPKTNFSSVFPNYGSEAVLDQSPRQPAHNNANVQFEDTKSVSGSKTLIRGVSFKYLGPRVAEGVRQFDIVPIMGDTPTDSRHASERTDVNDYQLHESVDIGEVMVKAPSQQLSLVAMQQAPKQVNTQRNILPNDRPNEARMVRSDGLHAMSDLNSMPGSLKASSSTDSTSRPPKRLRRDSRPSTFLIKNTAGGRTRAIVHSLKPPSKVIRDMIFGTSTYHHNASVGCTAGKRESDNNFPHSSTTLAGKPHPWTTAGIQPTIAMIDASASPLVLTHENSHDWRSLSALRYQRDSDSSGLAVDDLGLEHRLEDLRPTETGLKDLLSDLDPFAAPEDSLSAFMGAEGPSSPSNSNYDEFPEMEQEHPSDKLEFHEQQLDHFSFDPLMGYSSDVGTDFLGAPEL